MKWIQSTLSRARSPRALSPGRTRFAVLVLAILGFGFFVVVPSSFFASGDMQKGGAISPAQGGGKASGFVPSWSQAVKFAETPAVRDIKFAALSDDEIAKIKQDRAEREKNEENAERVKNVLPNKTAAFTDPGINNFKHK